MKRFIYILCAFGLLTGCNALDLSPVDYSAAGNYWKNEGQVQTFLNGLMIEFRYDYGSPFLLGEQRGGTLLTGFSIEGVSLNNAEVVANTINEDSPGVSNWNGYYGYLVEVNHYIEQVRDHCEFLTDAKRAQYLAPAYGLRAYFYFMLYRTWGGVPLETSVKLMEGHIVLDDLYMERASAEATLRQIKDDIRLSEESYGADRSLDRHNWSWYATQMLKAQVYLWSAKVSTHSSDGADTDPHTATGEPDLLIAKGALENLVKSGQFSLENNFADIFKYENKGGKEIILSVYFVNTEATNSGQNFVFQASIWNNSFYDESGTLLGDPLNLCGGGMHRHEWKEVFIKSMDKADKRRAATFFECYSATGQFGSAMIKNMGHVENSVRYYDSDIIVYRYADVVLMLAEVENALGNQDLAAGYINDIRHRAYGSVYPEFAQSDFAATELAILQERDKEFVGEGTRWFDLVRMHDAAGKPLAFSAEAAYPSGTPVLPAGDEYKLLWPVNTAVHTGDASITQTWGYNSKW